MRNSNCLYHNYFSPKYNEHTNLTCSCIFQIGGQCKEKSMENYKEKLIKDGNGHLIVDCPIFPERDKVQTC